MIKLLRLVLVLALTLPVISIIPKSLYAQTAQPTPPPLTGSTSIVCNNFASDLYYKLEYPFMAGGRYAYVNPVYVTFKKDMNTLHQILASKSISVSDSEKGNTPKFGKSTTEAVIQFQEQFKSQIGLTRPSGIVDEKTRQYLNQQYGCIDKALVTLTEPNKNTIRARGESLAIKWTASKIPNTTDMTIKYVNSTNPSASSTIVTLPNIRNGKGEYLWTIPQAMSAGNYKIVVALTGSIKSDESNAPFEIRETALEILTPNTEVGLLPGGKLPITWKTSSAIKPSDKIKINLQGTLISDGQSLINVEIAKVPNTGSYTWTVPDRINNKIVTTTSAFRVILQSEAGNYTSTSSPVVQLKPAQSVQTSSVAVSQPISSAQYQTGQTIPVRWTSKGLKTTDDVQISLIAKTGANAGTYIIGNTKNNGVFNWVIPASIGSFNLATTTLNQYQVLIVPTANTAVRATSSTFSIVPVPVTPPAPMVVSGISFTPQPAQVGSQMTAYFKNGGSFGSVMLKTLDGTKRWFVPYRTDTVVSNGFVRYDGNKITFTVPSTIGLGQLPENTGYEAPIPLTTGTYNASIWFSQSDNTTAESKITPIKINAISQSPFTVLTPIQNSALQTGSTYNTTWKGGDVGVDEYAVYLVGGALGDTGSLPLGTAYSNRKTFAFTIPSTVQPADNYRIQFSGRWVTGGESPVFKIVAPAPAPQMTATLDKTSVVRGSTITALFTGSVPVLSRVIATIVKADNSPVVGAPSINTVMNAGRATVTVPASLPAGQYKIYLSSTVNGALVQAYSPEFAVVNPYPVFTIDGTPFTAGILGSTGKTTSLTAVFNIKAKANGAVLTKLVPANFAVVFQDDVTGSTTPASIVVTSAAVANGATGNIKVTATIQGTALPTTSYYKTKINSIAWTMGTAPNITTGTETASLSTFVTPTTPFIK